jgi:hypothetical protein
MGDASLPQADSYVKFSVSLDKLLPPAHPELKELTAWRRRFFDMGLIGMYPNGVGFGNLSLRYGNSSQFLITGTATGEIADIDLEHCACVKNFDITGNAVQAQGLVPPSSECMTHAALYQSDESCRAVVHVHSLELWHSLRFQAPTTSSDAAYGTPAIAHEVLRLFRETDLKVRKLLVMGGHEKGIMTFGASLEEAGQVLLTALSQPRA